MEFPTNVLIIFLAYIGYFFGIYLIKFSPEEQAQGKTWFALASNVLLIIQFSVLILGLINFELLSALIALAASILLYFYRRWDLMLPHTIVQAILITFAFFTSDMMVVIQSVLSCIMALLLTARFFDVKKISVREVFRATTLYALTIAALLTISLFVF
jgi:MFS superfamily sulfate permease-like transporter